MAQRGFRVAVIGVTGAVGSEILEVLEQRRLPVLELLAFGSGSEADEIEFRGEPVRVERLDAAPLTTCDLVFCAAPEVLRELLPALRESDTRVIDLSGVLERDAAVPLHLSGISQVPASSRFVAIPRGVVAGASLALVPLGREIELARVTLVCLEAASAAGLGGVSELTEHTVEVLNRMTGETQPSAVFPQSLAFDCLPQIGELDEAGDSESESDLRDVLRRTLGAPSLPVEVTRVQIPAFGGSLASVSVSLSHDLSVERAREIWEKTPGLRVLDPGELPTARGVLGHDDVSIGRLRRSREDAPSLSFVLALNNLRSGAALAAVEVAELLLG